MYNEPMLEEEGSDKKKDDKEGVLLVGAVIEFLNNLDADIKTDISANISHILDQVSSPLL